MELDYQYIKSLVLSVQDGDSNAFAELYAATYQKQYRFAYNYLKDEFLAQDALQETYIKALKGIQSINDPQLFIAWLNQICFRVCFKLYQKQTKYHQELTEYNESDIAAPFELQKTQDTNPEHYTVRVEEDQYILKQILNLPFSESQALILRYYHEMKIEEVANLMNVSKSSVKRYIASGRAHLKNLLAEEQIV